MSHTATNPAQLATGRVRSFDQAGSSINSGNSAPTAPRGSVAELRAFVGETIGLAAVHAGLAETYASLGDDKGLEYALRCFAASCKAAFATFADLKAANIKGAANDR